MTTPNQTTPLLARPHPHPRRDRRAGAGAKHWRHGMKWATATGAIASFLCAGTLFEKGAPLAFICLYVMGGLFFAARLIMEGKSHD